MRYSVAEARLSEVVEEVQPGFACGEEDPNGIFQIRMNNILRDGTLDLSKKRRVPASQRQIKGTLLHPGDVLFNSTNSPDLVGKTALISYVLEPTVFSNHFLRLRTNQDLLHAAYLARWLSSEFNRGTFKGLARQWVNQATVGRDALLSLTIPLPTVAEQKRIIVALDQAEELQTKRRRAINLLDDLTQSIFLDMFGDPGVRDLRWPRLAVSQVAHQVTDGEHLTPIREHDGIKLLSARNIQDGFIDFSKVDYVGPAEYARISRRCNPRPGDILLSCSGTIGRVALVETDEPLSLVRSVALIKPNHKMIAGDYLLNVLRMPALRNAMLRAANASSQANLFQGPIRALSIPVPPITLQEEFSRRFRSVTALKATQTEDSRALSEFFASLQARAFRNEL